MSLYNLLALQEALIYKRKHSGFRALRGCLVGGHTSPRHASLRHTLWRCFWPPQSVARFALHLYGETVSGQRTKQQLYACGSHSCGVAGVWLQTKQTLTFSPSFPAGIVDLDSFPFPFDVDLLGSILKVTSCFTRIHSRATR